MCGDCYYERMRNHRHLFGYIITLIALVSWSQLYAAFMQLDNLAIFGHKADGSFSSLPSYAIGFWVAPPLTLLAYSLLRPARSNLPPQSVSQPVAPATTRRYLTLPGLVSALLTALGIIGGIMLLMMLMAFSQL